MIRSCSSLLLLSIAMLYAEAANDCSTAQSCDACVNKMFNDSFAACFWQFSTDQCIAPSGLFNASAPYQECPVKCPFNPTDSPCTNTACAETLWWQKPGQECRDAIVEYCQKNELVDAGCFAPYNLELYNTKTCEIQDDPAFGNCVALGIVKPGSYLLDGPEWIGGERMMVTALGEFSYITDVGWITPLTVRCEPVSHDGSYRAWFRITSSTRVRHYLIRATYNTTAGRLEMAQFMRERCYFPPFGFLAAPIPPPDWAYDVFDFSIGELETNPEPLPVVPCEFDQRSTKSPCNNMACQSFLYWDIPTYDCRKEIAAYCFTVEDKGCFVPYNVKMLFERSCYIEGDPSYVNCVPNVIKAGVYSMYGPRWRGINWDMVIAPGSEGNFTIVTHDPNQPDIHGHMKCNPESVNGVHQTWVSWGSGPSSWLGYHVLMKPSYDHEHAEGQGIIDMLEFQSQDLSQCFFPPMRFVPDRAVNGDFPDNHTLPEWSFGVFDFTEMRAKVVFPDPEEESANDDPLQAAEFVVPGVIMLMFSLVAMVFCWRRKTCCFRPRRTNLYYYLNSPGGPEVALQPVEYGQAIG